jgi:DNA-binding NtrC family response regulator
MRSSCPEEIREHVRAVEIAAKALNDTPSELDISPTGRQLLTLREVEDEYIQEVLVATGNNKTQAARILGIHPTSLLRRLKKEIRRRLNWLMAYGFTFLTSRDSERWRDGRPARPTRLVNS